MILVFDPGGTVPAGNVASFADALSWKYNGFHATQPKVSFEGSNFGFIPALEGPQEHNIYEETLQRRAPSDWEF